MAASVVLLALGLALTCGVTSSNWIGTPFPGFFVMANRVIASVSLAPWPVSQHGHIYQHAVVAVNDQPVASGEEIYAFVRQMPVGSSVTYTLEKDGRTSQITFDSLAFNLKAYFLLFVPYVLTGLALVLIGVGVWFLKPAAPASQALLFWGLAGGLFAITGADLYAPFWFFRLHVLSEAFFPAGLLALALVFPVDRLRRYRPFFLSLPYLVALGLGVAYQIFLYQPEAYSLIHSICMIYAGIAGLVLLAALVGAYATTDSYLVRQRIRVILLGFLGGIAFPAALMLSSGITKGEIAVNYAGYTAFLFPLGLGYAIVKHDLFEIDTLLKRGVYYLTLTTVLTLIYIAFLAFLNLFLQASEFALSPFFPLLFTLGVVLLLNPLKDYLQQTVDRVFFRLRYNPKKVLEVTSAALAATLQLEEILAFIWRTVHETMGMRQGSILLHTADKERYETVYPTTKQGYSVPALHPLIVKLQQKERMFAHYNLDEETGGPGEYEQELQELEQLGAKLLVPLILKGELIGLIALGAKESGAFFSVDDIDFLYTLANQSALSVANALSYQEIQELNTGLEEKVEERTQALAHANTELQTSLERLEKAYRDLQHSQENLLRAEKMAALGRLTAGIAHEMNTPLGASMTSLKLLQELVEEYRMSVGDPEVNEHDHRDIAAEMDKLVRATQQWMEKAATHIRSLKLHTRDLNSAGEKPFSVLQVIEDTGLLLSHRLRFSRCTLVVSCASSEPILYGDPGKLGQVLTNLVANAIDAYKDKDSGGGEIRIEIAENDNFLEIRVSDQGCGIPHENIEKVFDEFFSTKALGEGTGLGLAIARDIVTNLFGGTIFLESILAQGSMFILRLPRRSKVQPIAEERVQSISGSQEQLLST